MAPVTLRNVNKSYGATAVIHSVSIDIADGEFVALVGPSGCGKSTLLRMIAGLEPITAGEIEIGGRVVNDLEPKDRDIAMVFQNYALYPHMSVEKNMGFSLEHRGASKAAEDRRSLCRHLQRALFRYCHPGGACESREDRPRPAYRHRAVRLHDGRACQSGAELLRFRPLPAPYGQRPSQHRAVSGAA